MYNGNTALHLVCALQNHSAQVECVKLLMRKGADPEAKNSEKELPCHLVPAGFSGEEVGMGNRHGSFDFSSTSTLDDVSRLRCRCV